MIRNDSTEQLVSDVISFLDKEMRAPFIKIFIGSGLFCLGYSTYLLAKSCFSTPLAVCAGMHVFCSAAAYKDDAYNFVMSGNLYNTICSYMDDLRSFFDDCFDNGIVLTL